MFNAITSRVLPLSSQFSAEKLHIRRFRHEKGTEAEMRPTIVSGNVTRDAPVGY